MKPVEPSVPRRHTLRWVVLGVGLVALSITAVSFSSLGTNPATLAAVDSPLLGKPAPAFSLANIDTGRRVTLASMRGHDVLINFWASWCVACIEETPELVAFYARQHPRGVDLVGISYNDTVAAERSFEAKWRISWPLLEDPSGVTSIDYGIYGIPETFVVDPNGTVVAKLVGRVGPHQLDEILARLNR